MSLTDILVILVFKKLRLMRYKFIVISIYLICFQSISQNKVANSLQNDTLKCFNLNQKIENEENHLVWINFNNDLKKIAAKNLQTKSQVYKKTFLKYYSISLLNQGAFYHYTDRYQLAIEYYKKSFSVANDIKFYTQCASSLQNIGSAFDFLGKIDSSIVYFESALVFAKKSNKKSNIAYVLTDLGFVYNNKGNSELAINKNIEALKIFESINDFDGLERTYLALGRIFDNQQEYSKAINYYKKGLAIAIKENLVERQNILYNSLSNSCFYEKKYFEAEKYAKIALQMSQKSNAKQLNAIALNHLAKINIQKNNLLIAEEMLKKAAIIFKQNDTQNSYARVLLDLAGIYIKKNKKQQALQYALEAYKISNNSNFPSLKKDASEILILLYENDKNFKEAFYYQKISKKINDSIFYDENKNITLKAEFKYEAEKKEAQIKSLSQQKKIANLESQRQKTFTLVLAIAIISILITSYFLFNRYKIKKQNELLKSQLLQAQKTIEAEKKATESELKALKSQMNPHFIFNALSSIQDQFMYGDKVIANEQMGNFTYLTRQILNVSGKKQILLATEIDILSKYLELEKMRFKTDFEYIITTSENIDEDYHEIPPMLIQPFVENSIKHGLLHKTGLKKITIDFELDTTEEFIICTVIDNGIGREKSAEIKSKNSAKHQSFSTESIEQRLELLNDNLKLNHLVVYEDVVANEIIVGTKVVVNIPLV
jgi:two-component system, LytTR family, sensor kinase